MSTLGTMRSRLLQLTTAHLLNTDLTALLNRVHQEEVESYPWSRMRTNTVVNSVAPTSLTGTVTQGSAVVSALSIVATAALVGQYLRITESSSPIQILSVDGGGTFFTLVSPWPGTTAVATALTAFTRFYSITGAQRILNVQNQIDLGPTTEEELNEKDPLRISTADPSVEWAPVSRDSSDNAQFEIWPIASAARAYTVWYIKGHTDLVNDSDRPLIPGAICENKALHECAMQMYAKNGDERWLQTATMWWQRYMKEREDAREEDRKQFGTIGAVRDAAKKQPGWDVLINHDF